MTISKGRVSIGSMTTEPDDEQPLLADRRAGAAMPCTTAQLTFDRLSSVFAAGNKTRDDQPNHLLVASRGRRPTSPSCGRTCARRRSTPSGRRATTASSTVEIVAVELRAVRGHLRQGRAPDAARGRLRPRVLADLSGTLVQAVTRSRVSVEVGRRLVAGICQRRKPLSYFSW